MKGLINEARIFILEDVENDVRDAGLIADLQRIEHYEISAYGTVFEFAKALGKRDVAKLLEQSLREEINADQKLNQLAIDAINIKARV
jgi:ferritin-like metal-binding protein YciE